MSGTDENEVELRKMLDFTKLAPVIILLLHFYYCYHGAFKAWKLTATISDRLLANIAHTGLFKSLYMPKLIALGLLVISLLGAKGRKEEKLGWKTIVAWLAAGVLLYFLSEQVFNLNYTEQGIAVTYMVITGIGFLCILSGGTLLSRLIKVKLSWQRTAVQPGGFSQKLFAFTVFVSCRE